MAGETFREIWSEVASYCPFVPIQLPQRWVQRRFTEIQGKALWASQRKEGSFFLETPATGTINVTSASSTLLSVTDPAGGLGASCIGSQIFFNSLAPYYTISNWENVRVGPYNYRLTIDRPFKGASATAVPYQIEQIYLTPPSDFLAWIDVVDPQNEWRLWLDVPRVLLDRRDPTRSSSGTPRVLGNATFSSAGVPRYEVWERAGISYRLDYNYYASWPFSSDTDVLPAPFNGSIVVEAALADLCRWPGTEERQNPLYDLGAAKEREKRVQELLNQQMREDQEIYQTDISYREWRMAPIDARWLQRHDPEAYSL